jgi:hypothetical protein
MDERHCLFVTGSLPSQGKLSKISTLQALKTFLKKKLVLLLLCIGPCWIMIGCTYDKLSDEAEKESPHITYRRLMQACKEHAVHEDRKASFEIEKITYKAMHEEYEKFLRWQNPDCGGKDAELTIGKKAWEDLETKLISDGYVPEDLKKITQGLLEYLQTHPTPK